MAAEQKRMDAATGRDKMVDVKSYQKGSEGRTMKLPVGVVESIKQRVNPLIEE